MTRPKRAPPACYSRAPSLLSDMPVLKRSQNRAPCTHKPLSGADGRARHKGMANSCLTGGKRGAIDIRLHGGRRKRGDQRMTQTRDRSFATDGDENVQKKSRCAAVLGHGRQPAHDGPATSQRAPCLRLWSCTTYSAARGGQMPRSCKWTLGKVIRPINRLAIGSCSALLQAASM